jgi:hypothetical protein
MRIVVTRSGGFGGLTRTWSLEVSRTEAEQRWLPLAEAEADAEADTRGEAGADVRPSAQRDRFTYSITVGYTEVQFPESELHDPWKELIDRARAATSARQVPPSKTSEGGNGDGNAGPGPSQELL